MSTTSNELSFGEIGSRNILVHCDALALVERVSSGTVELCYIDPPLFPELDDATAPQDRTRIMRDHLLALTRVLQQARRCLTSAGNILVHSEPEMNGSIRLLLDQVFDRNNFRQEIIVPRQMPRTRRGPLAGHDTIFHFSAGSDFVFNPQTRELAPDEFAKQFAFSDERGPFRLTSLVSPIARPSMAFDWQGVMPPAGQSWRYSRERLEELQADARIVSGRPGTLPRLKQYVSETTGTDVGTVWDDLPTRLTASERAGYPTQKSERLLERLIKMASESGGLVLDPFCGSGTTLVAANKCGRRWIGGDNSSTAIAVSEQRLHKECSLTVGKDFHSANEHLLKMSSVPHFVPFGRIATGFDDLIAGPIKSLVLGKPLEIEETRQYEFKEVKPGSPLNAIADVAEKYAVAFLNSEGGRIFWGVRGSDRIVVGAKLTFEERDRLRQSVTSKLGAIRPSIDPTAFRFEIHPVEAPGETVDLVVVELVVPRVKVSAPYFAGGVDAFVRLDGVTRKLAGPELTEWIVRRMSNT